MNYIYLKPRECWGLFHSILNNSNKIILSCK